VSIALKKLYVGNLPYQATGSDLEELFVGYGEVVSAQVVEDRETGRSRGFGFVEMGTDHEAHAAIDGLHDREYGGRRLTVNEARPREARAGSGGGYGGGRSHGSRDRGGYGGRY
jgi:RNA recognition motif-containing protein